MTFSDEELALLVTILEQRHRELLNEIAHTDSRVYKQGLRMDERILDSLVNRMQTTAAAGVGR